MSKALADLVFLKFPNREKSDVRARVARLSPGMAATGPRAAAIGRLFDHLLFFFRRHHWLKGASDAPVVATATSARRRRGSVRIRNGSNARRNCSSSSASSLRANLLSALCLLRVSPNLGPRRRTGFWDRVAGAICPTFPRRRDRILGPRRRRDVAWFLC